MPDNSLIEDIRTAHAKLRRLEDELLALRSQIRPAQKRIAGARCELNALLEELMTGQGRLPLFEPILPHGDKIMPGGKILVPQAPAAADRPQGGESPRPLAAVTRRQRLREEARLSDADRQPVRGRRRKDASA